MSSNECDILLEQVPAYCAGELDAAERARFESALPACPDAAAELALYRRMMTVMLQAVPQTNAPSGARARLLDALDDTLAIPTPRSDALQGEAALPGAPVVAASPGEPWNLPAAERPTQPRPPQRASPNVWRAALGESARRLSPVAAILAASVVLLLGLSALLWMRVRGLEQQIAGVPAPLVQELGAGELGRVDLVSTSGVEGQEGRMGWVATPDGASWVTWLVVENLPPLGTGEVYHLWLERAGDTPLSVGRFRTEAETTAFAFVIGEPIEDFDRAYVTLERADAPAPSSEPVIAADV